MTIRLAFWRLTPSPAASVASGHRPPRVSLPPGGANTKRPPGVAELPFARPVPGTGTLALAKRADEISRVEGDDSVDNWLVPIVADGEAGFGGALNVYELQKAMIQAGAAGTHWEDQLASEKKCGHLGGKVLIPTQQHIRTLNAARLAADGC